MQLKRWILGLPIALSVLTGCSVLEKFVYRIDIPQGNYVEQKEIDKLRQGMTKEQVRFVLGSPMLVETGYPDTWYYIYHYKPGHAEVEQKDLILEFDPLSGELSSLRGDYQTPDSF